MLNSGCQTDICCYSIGGADDGHDRLVPVTVAWLERCINRRELVDPRSSPVFTPIAWDPARDKARADGPLFSAVLVCLSGFSDMEKIHMTEVSPPSLCFHQPVELVRLCGCIHWLRGQVDSWNSASSSQHATPLLVFSFLFGAWRISSLLSCLFGGRCAIEFRPATHCSSKRVETHTLCVRQRLGQSMTAHGNGGLTPSHASGYFSRYKSSAFSTHSTFQYPTPTRRRTQCAQSTSLLNSS
jgi:hypothetical protein